MNLVPVIERLRACISGIRSIGGSADLDAAMRGTLTVPAVFVVPLAERGTDPQSTGVTRMRLVSEFAVIQVTENLRDATGAAALLDLDALRMQVRKALVGWTPDPSTGEPVTFTEGELIQFQGDGRLWWGDEFQVKSYFRGAD